MRITRPFSTWASMEHMSGQSCAQTTRTVCKQVLPEIGARLALGWATKLAQNAGLRKTQFERVSPMAAEKATPHDAHTRRCHASLPNLACKSLPGPFANPSRRVRPQDPRLYGRDGAPG